MEFSWKKVKQGDSMKIKCSTCNEIICADHIGINCKCMYYLCKMPNCISFMHDNDTCMKWLNDGVEWYGVCQEHYQNHMDMIRFEKGEAK